MVLEIEIDLEPDMVFVTEDEVCGYCFNYVLDGLVHYRVSCGHLYCDGCWQEGLEQLCGLCSNKFDSAKPVLVRVLRDLSDVETALSSDDDFTFIGNSDVDDSV